MIVAGYSLKEWWLVVAIPLLGFAVASIVGLLVAGVLIVVCAACRRRWRAGARGRDLVAFHHDHPGGRHE